MSSTEDAGSFPKRSVPFWCATAETPRRLRGIAGLRDEPLAEKREAALRTLWQRRRIDHVPDLPQIEAQTARPPGGLDALRPVRAADRAEELLLHRVHRARDAREKPQREQGENELHRREDAARLAGGKVCGCAEGRCEW